MQPAMYIIILSWYFNILIVIVATYSYSSDSYVYLYMVSSPKMDGSLALITVYACIHFSTPLKLLKTNREKSRVSMKIFSTL